MFLKSQILARYNVIDFNFLFFKRRLSSFISKLFVCFSVTNYATKVKLFFIHGLVYKFLLSDSHSDFYIFHLFYYYYFSLLTFYLCFYKIDNVASASVPISSTIFIIFFIVLIWFLISNG